jgi:hypothetical protein
MYSEARLACQQQEAVPVFRKPCDMADVPTGKGFTIGTPDKDVAGWQGGQCPFRIGQAGGIGHADHSGGAMRAKAMRRARDEGCAGRGYLVFGALRH